MGPVISSEDQSTQTDRWDESILPQVKPNASKPELFDESDEDHGLDEGGEPETRIGMGWRRVGDEGVLRDLEADENEDQRFPGGGGLAPGNFEPAGP